MLKNNGKNTFFKRERTAINKALFLLIFICHFNVNKSDFYEIEAQNDGIRLSC